MVQMWYDDSNNQNVNEDLSTKNNSKLDEYVIKNKRENVIIYATKEVGHKIRNAVTGKHSTDRVGSSNQDKYFSICLFYKTNKDRIRLFYDSPEQYESHLKQSLSPEIKLKWHNNHVQ